MDQGSFSQTAESCRRQPIILRWRSSYVEGFCPKPAPPNTLQTDHFTDTHWAKNVQNNVCNYVRFVLPYILTTNGRKGKTEPRGPTMITPALTDEVRRLLQCQNLSQRKIARQLGISRGTVNAIASGKRADRPPCRPEPILPPAGPLARCAGCGGLVQLPCLLCQVRALKEAGLLTPRPRTGNSGRASRPSADGQPASPYPASRAWASRRAG